MRTDRQARRSESCGATLLDGVLVTVRPQRLEPCCRALEDLPGVEVHHREPRTGRVVAVVESGSPDELAQTLRRIRAIPDVLLTAVVYHYPVPAGPETAADPPERERFSG